jgi:hypothetical protein
LSVAGSRFGCMRYRSANKSVLSVKYRIVRRDVANQSIAGAVERAT